MAMTRLQVLDLYLKLVADPLLGTRIGQLLNMLTPAQRNAVWATVKSDILTVLNNQKTILTESKAETVSDFDNNIAGLDVKITDVTNSTP